MANNNPIFSKMGVITGGGILTTAAADYTGLSINNLPVITADATNGGFIQRLRFKALGTNVATVARLFINNGLGSLASICAAPAGTPTGTPSGSGGTLQTGTYFAKIQAIDEYGAQSGLSTETASVSVTGPTGSIAWAWTASASAASYRIWVGQLTGSEIMFFTSTTNSYTQTDPVGTLASPLNYVTNNMFHGELSLPATTASASTGTIDADYPLNLALPPGYRLLVGLGTTVAAGWAVSAIAGSY